MHVLKMEDVDVIALQELDGSRRVVQRVRRWLAPLGYDAGEDCRERWEGGVDHRVAAKGEHPRRSAG